MIDRYGLSVYKDGLSVYTTIDSKLQQAALKSIDKNLYLYDKRHGWREPVNLSNRIPEIVFTELRNQNTDILYETSNLQDELGMNQLFISIIRDYFENSKNLDTKELLITLVQEVVTIGLLWMELKFIADETLITPTTSCSLFTYCC